MKDGGGRGTTKEEDGQQGTTMDEEGSREDGLRRWTSLRLQPGDKIKNDESTSVHRAKTKTSNKDKDIEQRQRHRA